MQETVKQLHVPTAAVTVIVMVAAVVGGVVAWWFNEHVTVLEGGVPQMPRSEVVRGERRDGPGAEIFNYTFSTFRSAEQIERFYTSNLENDGWRIDEEIVDALQFKRENSVIRIVLHPQQLKTVFTLYVRHAAAAKM